MHSNTPTPSLKRYGIGIMVKDVRWLIALCKRLDDEVNDLRWELEIWEGLDANT